MNRPYDLVSVDVWDTLLRRRCHPDEVKFHTARYLQLRHFSAIKREYRSLRALVEARCASEALVGAHWKAQGFDDEYSLQEVYEAWLIRVGLEPIRPEASEALYSELESTELRFESWVSHLDEEALRVLDTYEGIDLVIASDFYMDGRVMERLLRRAGFKRPIRALFTSSEHRLNKRSGRLFEKIQQELGVLPERHLHIGDNSDSDVAVPRRLGMAAIHFTGETGAAQHERAARRFAMHNDQSAAETIHAEASALAVAPSGMTPRQSELYALGAQHAAGFIGFVYALIERAIQAGHQKIYYFTREGIFFRQIHSAIERHNPFPGEMPSSDLLEVSRLATFSPSLREMSVDELMRVWNQYSTQSLSALLRTLDLELDGYRTLLARHGIQADLPIQHPWLDPAVQALFADPDFISRMTAEIQVKRTRLLEYLKEHGIVAGSRRVAIVDIGWRGTIQDNLAALLPGTIFEGYYLGLYRYLNPQPLNVVKHGIFCDLNLVDEPQVAFQNASVLEMLCNSATGSVLRYLRFGGRVCPDLENRDAENQVWLEAIQYFQAGVLATVPVICQALRLHHIDAEEWVALGRRQLTRLIAEAPRALTRAYFSLEHNETFGVGRFVRKQSGFPIHYFFRGLIENDFRDRFFREIERAGWPQGLLRQFRLDYLIRRYNDQILNLDDLGRIRRK